MTAEGMAEGEVPNQKREWKAQFPVWEDVVAGVKLVGDRLDHNQIIQFRDRPPVAALERLADELVGFKRAFSKLIPRLRRIQTEEPGTRQIP